MTSWDRVDSSPNGSRAARTDRFVTTEDFWPPSPTHDDGDGDGGTAALHALREENAQLREALRSRAVIDQAKGVLILRFGVAADTAFAILRRWSQDRNVKVRHIAEALVHGICQGDQQATTDPLLARWLEQQLRDDTLTGRGAPGGA